MEGEKLQWASVGGPSQRFRQLAELQTRNDLPPSNAEIAELLSREASDSSYVTACLSPSRGKRVSLGS